MSAKTEHQVRDDISAQATKLLWNDGSFVEVDRAYRGYLSRGDRTPSGLWVHGVFANAVIGSLTQLYRPATDKDWERVEAKTLAWTRSAPKSSLARIVHAESIRQRAWRIRGSGYSNTVPATAWKPFYAHILRARAYLTSQQALLADDPNYYATQIGLIRESPGGADPTPMYEAGIKRFPAYYPIYFSMLDHLLPKWHGDAESIEVFAQAAAKRSRATEGRGLYARIYWYASQINYGDDLFAESKARWGAMKAGFDDVVERYPDQWNLQSYAKFACDAGDRATLAKLLKRIGTNYEDRAWGSRAKYESCRRMVSVSKR
ncbi:hypothetical protein [Lysobacter silvisoli]|nr:hypothetical protein [Lysobacter silvisoli]